MPDPESSLPIQAPARPASDPTEPGLLPPWKVLLHNDDVNDMPYVVQTISQLTPLSQSAATQRMLEAHAKGLALILTTHQERAELYRDQFASKNLSVTIEPDA